MAKKWMGLDPKNLTITGELAFRINRNFSRLEDKMYRPEQIFGADQNGWPETGRAEPFWHLPWRKQ